MTPSDVKALQTENAKELAKMAINAAGMVQSLLLDLGSNQTYISLSAALDHQVNYRLVEGTAKFVSIVGEQLGLEVSDSTIEVPHG